MGTDTHDQRVEEIFVASVELGTDVRGDFIERECAGDETLRNDVESLLAADHDARDFLESPALDKSILDHIEPVSSFIGRMIGHYRIESIIARGGMGTVFRAEQDQPQRIVAVKVMNQRFTSPSALRRFQYEAELLGALHHPNIAQVYDAGVHDDTDDAGGGLPYFAMEYIHDAKPITEFVRDRSIDLRGRLELFLLICDGVQHGHRRGIIHRDLKPANILVDGEGTPRIIDFGVARATDSDLALTTVQTNVGQLIGTLQYMSPEQCDGDSRDLDTRSDVYSLGLVLYELLSGHRPYQVSSTSILQAARVIRDEAPPQLSSIDRQFRGDIETIVGKAIEKHPDRRYQSAAELARDIRRHLDGDFIEARPPTRWSRLSRWIARHPVATTATACLLLIGSTVGTSATSVWFFNISPHSIDISIDRTEVYLRSRSGGILEIWPAISGQHGRPSIDDGLVFANLIRHSRENEIGQIALIGFSHYANNEWTRSAVAFPTEGDRQQPLWISTITDEDILPELAAAGVRGHEFACQMMRKLNIYPATADPEIVLTFNHRPDGYCVIRIHDLGGKLLNQYWHKGNLGDASWIADGGMLLFAGYNSEVPSWEYRGYDGLRAHYPQILFGLHPSAGHIGVHFLSDTEQSPGEEVSWYKCLLPPDASEAFDDGEFLMPTRNEGRKQHVRIQLALAEHNTLPGFSWLIDAQGNRVPGSLVIIDAFEQHQDSLPDPNLIDYGPLPPILPEFLKRD